MTNKLKFSYFKEGDDFFFYEEGGSMISSASACIISDNKGLPKIASELSSFNYSNQKKHALFKIENGDYVLLANRTFDDIEYSILNVVIKDGVLSIREKINFTPSTENMLIKPSLLNAFNVLKKKLTHSLYGPYYAANITK